VFNNKSASLFLLFVNPSKAVNSSHQPIRALLYFFISLAAHCKSPLLIISKIFQAHLLQICVHKLYSKLANAASCVGVKSTVIHVFQLLCLSISSFKRLFAISSVIESHFLTGTQLI